MIIEVLGGSNLGESKGALLNGDTLRLAIYDQSTASVLTANVVNFAAPETNLTFSANGPSSRGGSTPFNLSTTQAGTIRWRVFHLSQALLQIIKLRK